MKKHRLYIAEDVFIDMTPEGLSKLKDTTVQYDGKELAGKQLIVEYKELKYPLCIITPLENFLDVELPDEDVKLEDKVNE